MTVKDGSSVAELVNGNLPNICPRWIQKSIPPTQTTARYRGKYEGCYSYDGILAKGVSEVRVELSIALKHREPTGDPLTNRFQSQEEAFTQFIGLENPIRGEYCRSDRLERDLLPCVSCGPLIPIHP